MVVIAAALFSGCGDKKNNNPVVPDKEYTLTINVNPEQGEVSVRPPRDDDDGYRAGELVEATATAKPGYAFICWSGASTDSNKVTSFYVTGDMELTAKFGRTYTLDFSYFPLNSGAVSVSLQKDIYVEGDRVKITAEANSGYAFERWDGLNNGDDGDDTDSVVTITINQNRVITVFFIKVYTLTIKIDPENAGNVVFDPSYPQKSYYHEGDSVVVAATTKSGYRFMNWFVEPDDREQIGAGMTIVIGKNDVTLTANFEPIEPTPLLTQGED
jgi:uncharacterized repeat protein (TIGR02543 family)